MQILDKIVKDFAAILVHARTGTSPAFMISLWIASFLIWSALSVWRIYTQPRNGGEGEGKLYALHQFCRHTFLMGCIIVNVAIGERGIGSLVQPLFTWMGFTLIVVGCIILSVTWTFPTSKPGPMNVDLTNEVKGWMQAVILAYHYLGGYYVLPVYILMRVFVSTYIALSGFGHFLFYWNKFSPRCVSECSSPKHLAKIYLALIYRYAQVILRMNLLTLVLCLSLLQGYLLHYFVPLITYAYTLTAVTMTFWLALTQIFVVISKSTSEKLRTVAFIIVLTASILFSAILKVNRATFDALFVSGPLGWVLRSNEGEWQARWSLDRYSTQFGMLCGFIFARYKGKEKPADEILKESDHNCRSKLQSVLTFGLGSTVIGVYLFYFSTTTNHRSYVQIHPYVCYIPVIALLALRNATVFGRTRASVFFSWFGKFALELFVLQYHILLTKNMKKVFLVFPGKRILSAIIITPCFVAISYWTHTLTGKICDIILPKRGFLPHHPAKPSHFPTK